MVNLGISTCMEMSVLSTRQMQLNMCVPGTLVMVCSAGGGEAETLWCLSRVLAGAAFSEAHTLLALDGPAWALTALSPTHQHHLSAAMRAKKGILYLSFIIDLYYFVI